MHCYIYEVSASPIPEEEQYSLSEIPSWFFGSIADSASDVAGEERELAIQSFVECLGTCCAYENGVLQFIGNIKERYFRNNFTYFREALAKLMSMDYKVFSGQSKAHEFFAALSRLKQAVEDKFDCYIYSKDTDELVPMDAWMRDLDLDERLYFGGVIDYHW